MRKDLNDFSDNSSSLILLPDAPTCSQPAPIQTQKSHLQISIDALLGELSDIKAENGIEPEEEKPYQPAQL